KGLVALLPQTQIAALPFLANLHIDARVLVFSFGLSILTGMIFGLAPAIQASKPQLATVLKEGGRNASAGSGHRLRTAFVITEIALAVVLLVGSGLLLKSLFRLLSTSPGVNAENILTMSVVLPPAKYNNANSQVNFQDQLTQRISALPGVTAAGTVDILPLQPGNTTVVYVEGEPLPPPGQETEANVRVVSESYFQTMQVPLVEGRAFDAHDRTTTNPEPVIIGKTMADRQFKGRSALGRHLVYRSAQAPPITIIGVASDVKITGLDQELRPVIYYSFPQNSSVFANLVIRTATEPTSLAATVRHEIQTLEPQAAVFNVRPMPQLISAT